MSKHTEGPWVFHHNGDNHHMGAILGKGGEGDAICDFGDDTDYYPTEGTAPENGDLALILAAPDLLAACQTFAEWLRREEAGSYGQPWADKRDTPEGEAAWREWWEENLRLCDLAQTQARAAISKATGEK